MKKIIILFLILLCPVISYATILKKGPVTIEGYVKNETGWNMNENKFMKILNVIDVKGQFRPNDYFSLYAHINKFWDSAYGRVGEYRQAKDAMYTNKAWHGLSWVREMYVDFFSDYVDIRAGKQIVTWGTTDGIRILDEYVNPLDWREFSLKAWNDIKVPMWMLKVEVAPTVNGSLQFLFIPDFEPDYWPASGAPFEIGTTKKEWHWLGALKQAGFSVSLLEERPKETFENAKFGVRWRDILGNFEYTINYIYSWATKSPERVSIIDPTNRTYTSIKKYHRVHVLGFSFAKTFVSGFLKGLTLRGEFVYAKDQPWAYLYKIPFLNNMEGLKWEKTDLFNYAIGLDKYIVTNWFVSFQFIQLIKSKKDVNGQPFVWPSAGPMDKVETILTLKVSTDFFHERLKPSILIVYGDDNDWRISPETYIEISDHLTTKLGMHIFEGNGTGLHSQFNNKDEIYMELKYSF